MATTEDMAPFITNTTLNFNDTYSEIRVGDFNKTEYIDENSTSLVVTSEDPNTWVFKAYLGFGFTNTTYGTSNETASEYYFALTNDTYNTVEI